ncbi:MAG: preprotein translocase subunit SecE [Rhodococcus sp. (in: high G+C Gram-positive bacteria)]
MSEERGKREDGSEDSSASDSSAPGSPTPGNTEAGASPETGAAASSDGGAVKPSGKRTARRRVSGASDSDPSGAKVSISKSSTAAGASTSRSALSTREVAREPKRMNIFKRLRKFLREVIAELRKVIWPNRKQMVTYTSVVLVFVAFMVAFISGADMAFIRGIEWVFG